MDSLLYALREATDIRPLKHIHFILFLIVFLETRCVPPCNAIFFNLIIWVWEQKQKELRALHHSPAAQTAPRHLFVFLSVQTALRAHASQAQLPVIMCSCPGLLRLSQEEKIMQCKSILIVNWIESVITSHTARTSLVPLSVQAVYS